MKNNQTVFVGLSGGVDSSVTALRLKRDGYNVVGVFIKVWHPDFLVCNWEAERLDAMRVAAKLGIPFLTCDAEEEYESDVANYFIKEYQAGRTPNPDVMCNKYVKFGAFLRFAREHGADFVATGHYAQVKSENNNHTLWRGDDTNKDQSYFLWTLTQNQLSQVMLPIGDSTKNNIRTEAEQNQLATAQKKDSQGICFLGHVDIPDFLAHFIDLVPGDVLDEKGSVIGSHQGAVVYTLGQRHGFTTHTSDSAQKAHYVIDRNIKNNTITVSTKKPIVPSANKITLTECNFIVYKPKIGDELEVQTRYRQTSVRCSVAEVSENSLRLSFKEDSESVSNGQSCVLYRGNQCLGGGIISECL